MIFVNNVAALFVYVRFVEAGTERLFRHVRAKQLRTVRISFVAHVVRLSARRELLGSQLADLLEMRYWGGGLLKFPRHVQILVKVE
jgi:hypothetical protein